MFERSIILPAFFPTSMENAKHFLKAIKILKKYDICFIEFYYKGDDKKIIKEYLTDHNLKKYLSWGNGRQTEKLKFVFSE